MSTQADFGNDTDPVVAVPGALRGFRYFRGTEMMTLSSLFDYYMAPGIAPDRGVYSMQYNMDWSSPGWRTAECLQYETKVEGIPSTCVRPYYACRVGMDSSGKYVWLCGCQGRYDPGPAWRDPVRLVDNRTATPVEVKKLPLHPEAPAPNAGCTCGFYASYNIGCLAGAPGVNGADYLGVVEAAGRVILGTKGFRAEQMRIVALAPSKIAGAGLAVVSVPEYPVYSDRRSLAKAHPPEDISELIGKKPAGMTADRLLLDEIRWVDLGYITED